LEVCKAKGLIKEACHTFYSNLENLYTQHKYASEHIWNSDEIKIQLRCQSNARVLVRQGSRNVYNTIPKFRGWLTVNCVVNVTRVALPAFTLSKVEGCEKTTFEIID